jgi:hypothetical protein
MMRKPKKQRAGSNRLKSQERRDKPSATDNRHLAAQRRKILRTHYANKYRVR